MIFLTIVFIAYYLIVLVKGSFLSDLIIKAGEDEIKRVETGSKNVDESTYKLAATGCFFIVLLVLELIYLVLAISHDIYKYPTLILILYVILTFAFTKWGRKKDLTTDDGRNAYRKQLYQKNKRYSFKGFMIRLLFLTYFCYMFYILVFQ